MYINVVQGNESTLMTIPKEDTAALGTSTRTVESYRNHTIHKTDFRSFSEPMRFPIRNILVVQ